MKNELIVIVDSREQRPYTFGPEVQVRVAALPAGDYSLAGLEHEIVVERKELGDLLGCLTRDRARFTRELRQLRSYRLAVLMVESDWQTILRGDYRSQVSPSAVLGSLMAFAARYGVVPVLAGDRETAAILTEKILRTCARQIESDWKALARAADLVPVGGEV